MERYDARGEQATHRRWVEATASRFGRIDGLVNNAGMVDEGENRRTKRTPSSIACGR